MTGNFIARYRELAATDGTNFSGLSILQHAKSIAKLVKSTGAKSMLDYGCGRGDAYRSPHKVHQTIGISRPFVTLYDPAFRRDNELPIGRYDLVVCSDVLEHVPEDEVDELILRLFAYAKKAVWASVCCRAAKKSFPDGVNMHCTVQPYAWWEAKFKAASEHLDVPFDLVETP